MTRRLILLVSFLVVFNGTAWSKLDNKDKAYLDEQFRTMREEVAALKAHLEAVSAHLNELREIQAQVQAVLVRQQRTLQDMDQIVSSLRLSHEENIASLKTSISELRKEHEKAIASLTGRGPEGGGAATGPAGAPGTTTQALSATQGYVTIVEGNDVTVDLGSAQGIHEGAHLAVYKASDPATRVGVLQVTQVLDAGNSRARILSMNAGVRPEFSDIVRVE